MKRAVDESEQTQWAAKKIRCEALTAELLLEEKRMEMIAKVQAQFESTTNVNLKAFYEEKLIALMNPGK